MAKVIIVSNRLPISVKKENGNLVFSPSLGGIATGLSSYVSHRRGSIWIGWPGIASDELTTLEKQAIAHELSKRNYVPIFLSRKQIESFYNGYSNSVIWPLFHGLSIRASDLSKIESWWRSYQSINSLYAEAVLNNSSPDSQVWVHDYHLFLVPNLVKQSNMNASIGFFLHIPFPKPKRLHKISEAKKILQGLLGADLIGFHTIGYVDNFIESVETDDLGIVDGREIRFKDHVSRVAEFPMGIDYDKFAAANKLQAVQIAVRSFKRKYSRHKIIVSVDRLDPSKGLVERLNAYKQFLEDNPKILGKVVFAMVAAPSRTDIPAYKNLSRRLTKLSAEINEQYGTSKWQPVDYINRALPFEEVSALFQIADVAFIAPLADGMNLAAKEFVASNKKHGVLILSQTAGAAQELSDAIIVNPHKPETLVNALDQALKMRKRELRSRLKKMRYELSTHNVQSWAETFVNALQQPLPGTPHLTKGLNNHLRNNLVKEYRDSSKRLILMDYDGSLVPFTEDYLNAEPSKELIKLLERVGSKPNNDVVIISGRSANELELWFAHLPISLVAEHGAAIKRAGKNWKTVEEKDTAWKQILLPSLNKYATLTPGATVEVKPHSLVWHYRGASVYHAQKYAVIIKRALKPVLKKYGLELMQGNKVIEIKNPSISKGSAAQTWIEKGSYDFIMAVGDDITDEELFMSLPITTHSIKVGRGLTRAQFRVATYKDTLKLLRKLASV